MRIELFDYHLPSELIAQTPLERGDSRLFVLHRAENRFEHRHFSDILEYLAPGDTLILNNTRVTARRLEAVIDSGKSAEVFLVRPTGERDWIALVRPGRSLREDRVVTLKGPSGSGKLVTAKVTSILSDGSRVLTFATSEERDSIANWGVAPLPPYIQTSLPPEQEERYQTVYASQPGSAAAPTAGLHFTDEILKRASEAGINIAFVTLHVGIDTFRPVKVETISEHEMHGEWVEFPRETADIVNNTTGRVFAVGTTSVRALEAAAQHALDSSSRTGEAETSQTASRRVAPFMGETHLYITPGYQFKAVDALITNFHLPRSTLLLLISALASREQILAAYEEAIRQRYRFYSFGDAMLIL